MSGGFFRGTSADQDTRFSNKQAKLLKSQKFPAELEHLVDMTKVKMDVLRPWIAARATELLGFEDEVLINFVYGLLDGKAVDGKKIQIQLTGFMEKNTGKFMKELWGLLLSAQNNVSGVPQQFLDAKEEETRKKKEETDRIASEIQKRREKEGREPERGRKSRFEGEADISRSVKDAPDLILRSSKARSSSLQPEEEREVNGKHDSRAINGRRASPTGSNKRSISRSRSDSGNDLRSRSVSMPSQSQRRSASIERRSQSPTRRSLSPERRYKSPPRRSISPRRRYSPRITRSPSRRRSPRLRRRSVSRSRHRSPSPYRQRSPRSRQRFSPSLHRRSPSISRRRSPSPLRRRSPSPLRRRSPTPVRRRSPTPVRRRSPSPLRHRSPVKDRRRSPSPFRRRSPMRHRSPSPWRRSPLHRSPKHRRRSPLRSPKRHPAEPQYSPQQRKRSRSPYKSRSPLYRARRSLSTERGSHAIRRRDEHTPRRELEKRSPVDHGLDRKITERSGSGHKASEIAYRKVPISLRSPQRDIGNQNEVRDKVPAATEDSPSQSESPVHTRKIKPRTNRRSPILSKSPSRKTRIRSPLHDSPGTSRDEEQTGLAREDSHHRIHSHKRDKNSPGELGLKKFYIDDLGPERHSTDRVVVDQSPAAHGRPVHLTKNSAQRSDVDPPERNVQKISYSSDDIEYGPGSIREERGSRGNVHNIQRSGKLHPKDASSLEERAHNEKEAGDGVNVGKRPRPRNEEHREPHHNTESITRSKRKADKRNRHDSNDSDSVETDSDKYHIREKPRHKKTDKRKKDSDDSSSSDSQVDDRKEAKRRRRDEKRLRKEERRRRREERHRKRLERRASKEKVHSVDMVNPPSDFEKNHNDSDDSDVAGTRKNIHPNDADETESEQKKLEIELRKKALESLRAKKAISH